MASNKAATTFKKYTVQPTGIWAKISKYVQIDSSRSSGVPLNPLFRNPAPAGNDPKAYDDPTTTPAADIADNPYWKRDVRRSYPRLSVISQGDVVGLLTVGSKQSPKDDVLQIGDAGQKQLVEAKQEGEKGLPAFFAKDKKSIGEVLGPGGFPPLPVSLAASGTTKKYDINQEQSYGEDYPCRSFV